MRRRGLTLLICALLAGLTFLVHAPSLAYDFVDFDDFLYVTQSEALRQGLSGDLGWVFEPQAGSWVPATWLSFALDYEVGGLDPRVYHRTNVVLHTLGVVFTFLAFVVLTRDLWRSAFVSAVLAVHPVHVESVAWVAERKDVLSGLFLALCLGSYADYARRPFALRRYLPVVIFLGLGLLAKSTLVTIPIVLLLLDFWPLRRLQSAADRRRALIEKLPLLALCGVAAAMTLQAGFERELTGDFAGLPLAERAANGAISVARYIGLTFWPSDLAVIYPHPGYGVSFAAAAAAAAVLLGITAAATAQRDVAPGPAVGWGWFIVTLLPVLGIVHVGNQAMADRFLYVPQTGLALALAWAVPDRWLAPRAGKLAVSGVAGLAVFAMVAATRAQLPVWRDTISLFEHAVAVTEDNAIAHQTLGRALVRAGREREAVRHFERAARIEPAWGEPQLAQGRALASLGDHEQARRFYQLALRARPGWPAAQLALADSHIASQEPGKALHVLGAENEGTTAERAQRHALRARAQAERRNFAAAAASYRRAAALAPDQLELDANLGLVLAAQGRNGPALEQLERARARGYETAETRGTSAKLAFALGREVEGIAHLRAALEQRPNWVGALNDLSWRLSTARDPQHRSPDEALQLAKRASVLTRRREPEVLDTLATALAAVGRFDRAASVLDEAAQRSSEVGGLARAIELRDKRDRYRARAAASAQ